MYTKRRARKVLIEHVPGGDMSGTTAWRRLLLSNVDSCYGGKAIPGGGAGFSTGTEVKNSKEFAEGSCPK